MIQKVEMYRAVCERCGRKHGYEFSDDMARYMAKMCDWQEIDGKLYCPDCVEQDEETDDCKPKDNEYGQRND